MKLTRLDHDRISLDLTHQGKRVRAVITAKALIKFCAGVPEYRPIKLIGTIA